MDSIGAAAGPPAGPYPVLPSNRLPVLVGRAREQVVLHEELAAACSGRGRLVLLDGEAGIGKTTLAQDLIQRAAKHTRVLTGHCYDLTHTPPYGPWLDLVVRLPSDPTLPAPPAAFARGALQPIQDQATFFADVRRFLAELSAAGPSVVILEDLHWADPASLELLRHVAPHLRHWAILLLASYRGTEITRRHPFFQQLPALVRETGAVRLEIRRLDPDALRALVAARHQLPPVDEGRLVRYLERHAEGNPFFATELLRALEEASLLQHVDGRWRLGALDRVVMPSFLRQVITGRVERLGEAVWQPLTIAAVIGQEAPLALWARVANLDDEALLAIVEQATEASLMTAERDGVRVRFVHALTREALYESVLPPRRRLRHRAVAEALLTDSAPDPDAVAYHLQAAGDARASEWLERAGDRAQRAYAWLTAIERFRASAALLADVPGQERARGRLMLRLSRLQRFSDPASGLVAADEAGRLAAQVGDHVLVAEIGFHRGVLQCYMDHFRSGLAEMWASIAALEAMPLEVRRTFTFTEGWLADALATTSGVDPAGDARAAALLNASGFHYRRGTYPWFAAAAGRSRVALGVAEPFVAVLANVQSGRGGIRTAAGFASTGLGVARAAIGLPAEARAAFAEARSILAETDHHAVVAFVLLNEISDVALTYGAADPPARRALAAEAEAALSRAGGALRPGLSPRLAWLACLVVDGRWNDALKILRDLPDPGSAFLRREVVGARVVLAQHRGEAEIAWEQIQASFPEGPLTEPGDIIHQEGLLLQRVAADLCLSAGDLANARRWLEAQDRWLAWSGALLGHADGCLAWARYQRAAGDHAGATARAAAALARSADPDQPLVRLAGHRLLGELSGAAGNAADAEARLLASLDLAIACDAPFERALTLLPIAELRAAQGAVTEAARLMDEVRQICIPLDAAPTLARADALASRLPRSRPRETYPAGLTRREAEVLRLLGQRQTDKEIAETLFLGPRTVQSHVAHILQKLGVANRREAAQAAKRLGFR